MELRHLRTFRVVARTLNFTRAASELHYAQSSVTEQIQALEAELGSKLFERGRRLRLTSAGERLLGYADRMLSLAEEAKAAVEENRGEPEGELTIGALETLCAQWIPEILSEYRAKWPRVRLTLEEGGRGELYQAVRQSEVDVCFTFGSPPDDPAFASESLGDEPLVVLVPPGHPLADKETLAPGDLRGVGFLATPKGCGFREMLDRIDRPVVDAEVGSIAALGRCVAAGMGCALVPALAAHGDAVAVPLAGETTAVTMTWRKRDEHKPNVAALLATAGRVRA
ncbi:LysR family transcriptional regulator [Amycolatopsis sp. SID8362]|uniref:LysR family transcriptional regulator n=1 Tax=Amycolatopsis sp. SID8362 TaxID=2690346 RepID=UPI00136A0548|nr:LysR family transcriptional regulator [Amycolatopsis sp. SID8362]NBH11286.1 LysR family transcriptional regulator [Amycolatopsis sp. SID8362]NED47978.1 LysR family transcriptional regulator [Amycolatopsis sp. SID8362]